MPTVLRKDGFDFRIDFDADFSISGLLMGVFGSKSWMAELHRRWMQEQT